MLNHPSFRLQTTVIWPRTRNQKKSMLKVKRVDWRIKKKIQAELDEENGDVPVVGGEQEALLHNQVFQQSNLKSSFPRQRLSARPLTFSPFRCKSPMEWSI